MEYNQPEVERFYEDLQHLLELTPKKDVLFNIGDWNAKVGSQKTFCQENALVITNTLFQHHKRRLYTLTSPDGQH